MRHEQVGSFEQRESENFFRTLALNDIYGKPENGFALTHWVPHHVERLLLLQLAYAVSQIDGNPTILEAACGSGFVSKLLAADGHAQVIGADLDLVNAGYPMLGKSPGEARFEQQDFWDIVTQFSPHYDPQIETEREELLNKIRNNQREHGPVYEYLYHGVQCGDSLRLNDEVTRLQELARLHTAPSPINLVLCSFMPLKIDLTIPIRDGIYPECIVYTRIPDGNGTVGAGDFYNGPKNTAYDGDLEQGGPSMTPDSVISLNPGRNYRTVATWRTTQQNDWSTVNGKLQYLLGAEVVVQLRNDVVLKPTPPFKLEKYNFDIKIEKELQAARQEKRGGLAFRDRDFFAIISDVSNQLFGNVS